MIANALLLIAARDNPSWFALVAAARCLVRNAHFHGPSRPCGNGDFRFTKLPVNHLYMDAQQCFQGHG